MYGGRYGRRRFGAGPLAPALSCPTAVTVECHESTAPVNTGSATSLDNCDPMPTVVFSNSVASGDCAQAAIITRTWTAMDIFGNSTQCVQVITVADTAAPNLTVPGNVNISCDENSDPAHTGSATAVDIRI